jgi:hypothetical protein
VKHQFLFAFFFGIVGFICFFANFFDSKFSVNSRAEVQATSLPQGLGLRSGREETYA